MTKAQVQGYDCLASRKPSKAAVRAANEPLLESNLKYVAGRGNRNSATCSKRN